VGLQRDLLAMPCSFSSPTCFRAEGRYLEVFRHHDQFNSFINLAGTVLARTDILAEVQFPLEPLIYRKPLQNVLALVKNPSNIGYFESKEHDKNKPKKFVSNPGERNAILRIPEEDGFFLAKMCSEKGDITDTPWVIRRPLMCSNMLMDDFVYLKQNISLYI
jgi:hypothetical protein